jgi:cytochrome c-type biogenesis protein CcsB
VEALVKLSFYCFTAASISLVLSALAYLAYGLGRMRVRRAGPALATPQGTTFLAASSGEDWSFQGMGRFGTLLLWFGVVFQGLAVLLRTLASGRGPYSNMYEFSLAFVFVVTLFYGVIERKYGVRQLGTIVLPIAVGMVLYVWSLPRQLREVDDLIPALQNQPLMTAHVSAAILAYATFAVSFAAAVLYLVNERRRLAWLPSADMLDDIAFRSVTVGFPMLSLVLVLGSIWAYQAWGTYWSWDPKETSALFTWLVYAVYLHTRSLRGWRGRRGAYILLFGFAATIFTYYGNYFFGGLHAYGGV